jgi:hypothetical protein
MALVEAWSRRAVFSVRRRGCEPHPKPDPASKTESIASRFPSSAAATLGLWAFLLVFGGGCLALYYARIGYIPEIHWDEALTELFVLSLIGGCVVALFGLLAFLPGAIWSEALIWDPTLQQHLCYVRDDCRREPCPATVWRRLGYPFAVFVIFVHIGFWLGFWPLVMLSGAGIVFAFRLYLRGLCADGYGPAEVRWWSWPWFLTAWCSPPGGRTPGSRMANPLHPHASKPPHSRLTKYLFWFLISLALGCASLLLEPVLLGWRSSGLLLSVVICPLVIIVANLAVAMLFKLHLPAAILTGVVAAFLLLVAGEAIDRRDSLLHRTLGAFGVGEDSEVVLVAKADARQILDGQGIPYENVTAPGGAVRVTHVSMLSRLGINYFLRYGGRQFLLPKDKVWSWSAGASPRIVLRDRKNDFDLVMEAGRMLGRNALFAGAGASVTTRQSRPDLVLTMKAAPSNALSLVQLTSDYDQRILRLTDSPKPGAELEPAAKLGNLSIWREIPEVWHLSPGKPLPPGEYGLWDSSSGELAAFSVDKAEF